MCMKNAVALQNKPGSKKKVTYLLFVEDFSRKFMHCKYAMIAFKFDQTPKNVFSRMRLEVEVLDFESQLI